MNFSRFSAFCVILWCSEFAAEAQSFQNALLFDLYENKLVEFDQTDDSAKCFKCLTACPATSNSNEPYSRDEQIINENASIIGHSVFLKQVYDNFQAKEIKTDVCENPLKPVIVRNKAIKTAKSYEIGYELFYKEGEVNLQCWDYERFVKVADEDGEPKQLPNNDQIRSYEDRGEVKFQIINQSGDPGPKMEFYWIQVLWIETSKAGRERTAGFTKDVINDNSQTIRQCETYYLADGKEIPKISKNASQQSESQTRLEKTQILPMRMFHTLSAKLATCTCMNIAYVWNTISEGQLKKIDLFLYALYRLWPDKINLCFGVSGELTDIIEEELRPILSDDTAFLQFPIPRIIYRFVEYQSKNDVYYAVIVIHNEIHSSKPICEKQLENWHDIKNPEYDTPGMTYVCPLTKNVVEKLGIDGVPDLSQIKDLNLTTFPRINDSDGSIAVVNILQEVQNELERIRKLGIVD